MSELPAGWELARIADVVEFYETIDPHRQPNQEFQYVDIGSIDNQSQKIASPKKFLGRDAPSRARRVVKSGDVLFSTVRTYLKNIAIVPGHLDGELTSTGIALLRPNSAMTTGYLFNWVRSVDFISSISKSQDGTLYPAVKNRDVAQAEILVPPLAEQKRIVSNIDSLTARTARAWTDLDHIPALLEKQKIAVLRSAFGGKVVPEGQSKVDLSGGSLPSVEPLWRVPSHWKWFRTDQVGDVGLGRQRSPKNHEGPNMRPYIRSANITWSGIVLTDVKEMNFDDKDFSRFKLEYDDVLLNEGSGSATEVGKPAIWQNEIDDCCFQNTVLRVQPKLCSSKFLYYYFLYTALTERFVSRAQGVNIQHIGKVGLAKYPVPVPPEAEQAEIVNGIETAFVWLDRVSADHAAATKLLPKLDAAILSKAFRGELAPQDPNDEPTSILLARTRAEREAASKKPKQRATKDKSMTQAPRERLLQDSETWPDKGLPFEQVATRNSISYDEMRDAIFELLSGPKPTLRQVFDKSAECMHLQRIKA